MSFIAQLNAQNKVALREGLKIVRKVVAVNPNPAGLTTAELFKLSVKEEPPAGFTYEVPPRPPISHGKSGYKRMPAPLPPHPEHPIRSMKFLKKAVLPVMEGNKEIRIVRSTRVPFHPVATQGTSNQLDKDKRKNKPVHVAGTPAPVTVWVWKAVDQSMLPKRDPPQPPRKLFGAEVGVGEDWSHLNKRRQKARVGKVNRDLAAMRVVEAERKAKEKAEKAEKARELFEEARRESRAKPTSWRASLSG